MQDHPEDYPNKPTDQEEPMVPIQPETPEPEETETAEEFAATNQFSRVLTVLWAPGEAMRGVKITGGWVAPLILLVVIAFIYAFLAGDAIMEAQRDRTYDTLQQRVEQGQMSQDQADRAYEQATQMGGGVVGKVMTAVGMTIGFIVANLIYAALALLFGNVFMGASERFGKYWSMIWYVGVIGMVGILVMGILISITGDVHGGYLGLAMLTKDAPMSAAHQVATMVDVFTIWQAIVVGIGLSIFARKPVGTGILWGFVLMLVLPALFMWAMSSIFGGFMALG